MNPTVVDIEEQNLLIRQYQLSNLSHLAYYIESEGKAVVINPVRDVTQYTEFAASRNASIQQILLTHLPADYVSGHLALSKQTAAPIIVGPNSHSKFDQKVTTDGQILNLGGYQIRVIHTPGHTIESCCYLLESNGEQVKSLALFTGNTLLLGDICGPDQTEAKTVEDQTYFISNLYDSLRNKVSQLDDHIIVYPGHSSGFRIAPRVTNGFKDTLGNQKSVNRGLQNKTRELFIQEYIENLVSVPQNYHYLKKLNKELTSFEDLEKHLQQAKQPLTVDQVIQLQKEGSVVLDCRPYADFLNGHISQSVSMTLSTKIELWISMIYTPESTKFVLICQSGKEEETFIRLARVGYDISTQGTLEGGFESYVKSGYPITTIANIDAATFINDVYPKNPYSMDVRDETDFEIGHVLNSTNVPVSQMSSLSTSNTDPFPRDQPIYVFCNGGGRAPIGCSLLKAQGYSQVIHVQGGMSKLKEKGIQLTQQ